MGLLDQVIGGPGSGAVGGGQRQRAQSPGLGGTVAAGVVLALLVKAVRTYESSHSAGGAEGRSFDPATGAQGGGAVTPGPGGLGGVLGGLGGLLGGGGLSNIIGRLGGAGALGGLISQLQQKGFGGHADSWVAHGENQPLAPAQLAEALGDDNIQALQQQTGMPRDALLTDLAHVLPTAIDEATPQGRLPSEEELERMAAGR